MSILIPSLAMGWGPAPPPPPTGWTLPMQPEAVFIAAFPILLGLIFMIKARTEMVDIMKPGSIPKAYGNKDAAFFGAKLRAAKAGAAPAARTRSKTKRS